MAQENAQQLEKPQATQSPPTTVEARVFTMPERYRHGAQAILHQPETKQVATKTVEVKTPGLPPPKAPPKPASKLKKRSHKKMIILIGGIVLLLLGVGGYFLLQGSQPAPVTPPVASTPRPAPVVKDPVEKPVEVPVEVPDKDPDLFPIEVMPGVDSDSDGLTDLEETLIYGTDSRLPDTDSDGFLDGNEVFHRYNPGAVGTLFESGLVKRISRTAGLVTYQFFYPTSWEIEETDEGLRLDAQSGEGFLVSFVEKDIAQNLEDWADETLTLKRPLVGTTKNGLEMIQGENQLNAYIDLGPSVIAFEYDTGVKARVDYLQTFQMMLNSVLQSEVVAEEILEEVIDETIVVDEAL